MAAFLVIPKYKIALMERKCFCRLLAFTLVFLVVSQVILHLKISPFSLVEKSAERVKAFDNIPAKADKIKIIKMHIQTRSHELIGTRVIISGQTDRCSFLKRGEHTYSANFSTEFQADSAIFIEVARGGQHLQSTDRVTLFIKLDL